MNFEKLKEMLANGEITQEQFEAMVKALGLEEPVPNPEPAPDPEPAPAQMSQEAIEKLIQSSVDRATNKLGNENKTLRETIERLKKEKLTEEEIRKLDAEEKEKELAEREQAVRDAENKMYALKALKKAGLDDGSESALELLDMVRGADEAATDANIKAFKNILDRMVKAEVDRTFKSNGRTPEKGAGTGGMGDNNPYMPNTFNLTEQMELERTNPEMAKKYKAAAGIFN